jgi:hypothetical protein
MEEKKSYREKVIKATPRKDKTGSCLSIPFLGVQYYYRMIRDDGTIIFTPVRDPERTPQPPR